MIGARLACAPSARLRLTSFDASASLYNREYTSMDNDDDDSDARAHAHVPMSAYGVAVVRHASRRVSASVLVDTSLLLHSAYSTADIDARDAELGASGTNMHFAVDKWYTIIGDVDTTSEVSGAHTEGAMRSSLRVDAHRLTERANLTACYLLLCASCIYRLHSLRRACTFVRVCAASWTRNSISSCTRRRSNCDSHSSDRRRHERPRWRCSHPSHHAGAMH
jgi:hypothetical protein